MLRRRPAAQCNSRHGGGKDIPMRLWIAILAAGSLLAAPASAIVPLDGTNLHAKFGGTGLVQQTTGTGFGNNYSELDQLWATDDSNGLHVGISGNMENNGNTVVLLFDAGHGGSSVLNAPGSPIANRNGNLTFDDDFTPSYGVVFNNYQGTLYSNEADFVGGTSAYIGNAAVGGGPGGSDPLVQFALNNSNTAGVNGTFDPAGDPDTADTGLELLIGNGKLGLPTDGGCVKMLAYLAGTDCNYMSNQFLVPIPANANDGGGNYGYLPIDLRTFTNASKHYVAVNCVPEPGSLGFLAAGLLPLLGLRRRK
jgi:hypothetical protein